MHGDRVKCIPATATGRRKRARLKYQAYFTNGVTSANKWVVEEEEEVRVLYIRPC